ncbi:MAG: putative thiol:disulfide interchange protein DsbC precursor [Syntrophus sp. PtaB.Bin001]|nr:MAG: putative thiol:disulfide interchange protein DsbC precursor [Syntrophus sp. PtaB.Bin001]
MDMCGSKVGTGYFIKFLFSIMFALLFFIEAANCAAAGSPEESFKKSFPSIPVERISETAIKGVYEVIVGNEIAYYAPEPDILILGQLITKDGKNLTQEKISEIIVAKAKNLPLDQAIKVGKGPQRVIEITDPDCPYCRKASAFFNGRTDVTRYIFFYPLPIHKDAEAKALFVLCAKDQGKAYEEAMTGKLDDMKFKPCKNATAEATLQKHKDVATRLGLTGTPFFLIGNQPIIGANIPLMEKLLAPVKEAPAK